MGMDVKSEHVKDFWLDFDEKSLTGYHTYKEFSATQKEVNKCCVKQFNCKPLYPLGSLTKAGQVLLLIKHPLYTNCGVLQDINVYIRFSCVCVH